MDAQDSTLQCARSGGREVLKSKKIRSEIMENRKSKTKLKERHRPDNMGRGRGSGQSGTLEDRRETNLDRLEESRFEEESGKTNPREQSADLAADMAHAPQLPVFPGGLREYAI
jgi:hypothetical protein